MELGEVKTVVKSGSEPFHLNGKKLNQNVLSFWQWSHSEILGNTLRGILAEYIVSMDVKCPYEVREEWDAFDLVSQEGVKIEVKSSSYIQSWKQSKLSKISFGIQPTIIWDEYNHRSSKAQRQSDVYVFCLLAHKEQKTIDPLNLEQWEFYVLPTRALDERVGNQKTITLSSLLRLNPKQCGFGEINEAIEIQLEVSNHSK
ncbi:MAG: hypothetical protein COB41_08795 [Proteobacteria bacterium]|nr:MAG: hypothetical protein COB41_08795 [Pseudomonadota bacterium]